MCCNLFGVWFWFGGVFWREVKEGMLSHPGCVCRARNQNEKDILKVCSTGWSSLSQVLFKTRFSPRLEAQL